MKENSDNNINLKDVNFLTNTPKSYDDYSDYAIILDKMVKDENIKNIGIVAPYGAGKSSLIKKYIEIAQNNDKIITISLANYNSILKNKTKQDRVKNEQDQNNSHNDTDKNSESKNKNHDCFQTENEIEKSILQQLFYKTDNKKTPFSRFAMISNKIWSNIFVSLIVVLLLFNITILTLFFSNVKVHFLREFKHNDFVIWIMFLSTFVFIGILIYIFIRSKRIKNIQVGSVAFEKQTDNDISVLNQYLDEIIYFFQNNQYNIIVIEDLDRFVNLEIFSKLKELNVLLNNNDNIIKKHKKITFIYAVKDSMFSNEEERSKFFEFIIPVIPSITRDNVQGQLVKELKKIFKFTPIRDDFIVDICDYIKTRRILNNIINDFIIHLKLLNIDQNDNEKCTKLFSLMALKNIDPSEYELLQKQDESSSIYYILKNQKTLIQEKLIVSYDKKIQEIKSLISASEEERLRSFEELKMEFLGYLSKEGILASQIRTEITTFKDINDLKLEMSYYTYTRSTNISSLEMKYFKRTNYFYEKEINIENKKREKQKELSETLYLVIKEKNSILSLSFSELYEKATFFNIEIEYKNDLTKLLLVNGYIDETHMDYLSKHDNYFLSQNDQNIIRKINLKENIGYLTKIDNSERVVLSLHENRFKFVNLINFAIIDFLFKSKNKENVKKRNLIECLQNNKTELKNFLTEIIISDINYFDCVLNLLKEIEYIWKLIEDINTINEDIKNRLLKNIVNHSSVNMNFIKKINIDNILQNRINKMTKFGNEFNSSNFSIIDLNNEFGIEIFKLEDFYQNLNNEMILNNNLYVLNYANICEILENYYEFSKEDILNKNYELVCSLEKSKFYQRINENLSDYCCEIYNNIEIGYLNSQLLLSLLINENLSLDLKKLIVSKESELIIFDTSFQLDEPLIDILIKKNQIILPLYKIIEIYKNVNEENLVIYINTNVDKLDFNSDTMNINKDFEKWVFNKIDIERFKDKLDKHNYCNLEITNDKNLLLLIENDCMKYDWNDFISYLENDNLNLKYFEKFEKEIAENINDFQNDLKSNDKLKIYKITKNTYKCVFDELIKILKEEDILSILDFENVLDFLSVIDNYDVLTYECKCCLLKQNINNDLKEKIIITLRDISFSELKDIIFYSLNIDNSKYEYINYEFYNFVHKNGLLSKRLGNILYFKKDS